MKGRKRACPTSIRSWQVSIYDPVDLTWVRIRGLESLSYTADADTEDGSTAGDTWEENRVTKRSATFSLEGKPVTDAATGTPDRGQELLCDYAQAARCEGDALIRIADPWGRAFEAYCQVTGYEISADTGGDSVSWDLAMVGESDPLPYVQASGIAIRFSGEEPDEIVLDINDAPRLLQVSVTPEDASNKRYAIRAGGQVVHVGSITDDSFTIAPMKEGTGTIRVTSINNGLTDVVTVIVTNDAQPFMTAVLGIGMLGAMVLGRAQRT